jgi:glycine/D-amino acid oxidase-like deaminating enzyme
MPRVIICGAGWAGLNCARILQDRGIETLILERSDRVGGRIRTQFKDGFTIDSGFQVINPSYAELRETGILESLETFPLPKGVEIVQGEKILRVGDPRSNLKYLPTLLSNQFGSISEKIAFLVYLRSTSRDVTFEEAMAKSSQLFEKLLKPFLDGVTLTDSRKVSNKVIRELIHWFIKGRPALVDGGLATASDALAAGLDIEFNVEVIQLDEHLVKTNKGEYRGDAVVLAVDPGAACRLLGIQAPNMNYSESWYFDIPSGTIQSTYLRIGGFGPVINSIVLSNLAPSYAPAGRSLLVATSLIPSDELTIRANLTSLWGCDTANWRLIDRISIPNSLPLMAPGSPLVVDERIRGIWIAGDWRATPSQQGALLSGKLVANSITAYL